MFCARHSLEDCRFDINLNEYLRHAAWMTNDVADHVIRASELRVNLGSNGEQSTWNGIHEVIVISLNRHDN